MSSNMPISYDITESEQEILDVMKYNLFLSQNSSKDIVNTNREIDLCIGESERILKRYGELPERNHPAQLSPNLSMDIADNSNDDWENVVIKARQEIGSNTRVEDILSPEDILKVETRLSVMRNQFNDIYKLDKVDWLIAGSAGVIAALVDIFLVQMPKHGGFLGGEASKGGPLSNFIRERVRTSISPEDIRKLEAENWVPYDASSSKALNLKVSGLGPNAHRFQSLGHDPILGFLFGVKDILRGEFTAIDKAGKIITQKITPSTEQAGMGLFAAIFRQFGHLRSDMATKASLPVPLMSLLQLIQKGSFGKHGYTIGELTRIMYREGYNFNHFLSMSVSVLLIEVLVRGGYFVKRLKEGYTLSDSIPFSLKKVRPKLQTMLFTAHTISTTANLAKFLVVKDPLAINFPQWIWFVKCLFQQLNWILLKKPELFDKYYNKECMNDWNLINKDLNEIWTTTFDNH